MVGLKFCKGCSRDLPFSSFYGSSADKQGHYLSSRCKECTKSGVRDNYCLTREDRLLYDKKRQQTPERRAKKREYNRAAREKNPNRARDYQRALRARDPEKYKARTALGNALRDGRIKRRPCRICRTSKDVHGHHTDYSRPLDVEWLCRKCHSRLHGQVPTSDLS